jgi:tRNA G18 (ribose-2'-O)-methylase SpoU
MQSIPPQEDDPDAIFEIRRCTRPGCGLRFSMVKDDPRGLRCPACRALTEPVEAAYSRMTIPSQPLPRETPVLEVLLDNVRSAWNVGSMLRTADGAGVRRVHLCGVSATPDNPKVAKTALGAEMSLPWQYHRDGVAAARQLKEYGNRLWALEGGPRAEDLFAYPEKLPGEPLVLVVGNELAGVDPGILDLCERVVSLPMQGVKGSLNVAVAFGIAVYYLRFGTR